MVKKAILLNIFILLIICNLNAQFYTLGQDPSNIKWREIKTDNFKFVYPDYYEKQAHQTLKLYEHYRLDISRSLGVLPKKIPIIVRTNESTANGITAWAPRRIELYSTTPQDSYPLSWQKQLALHEYRHVVQFSKLSNGLGASILKVIFGELASVVIAGLFVPSWYMEGDAVCIETALSKTGRGREASFARPMKAQLVDKGVYSYSKAFFGSYKDFVPNKYILGYHFVAKTRNDYGSNKLWDSAMFESADLSSSPITPFNYALKKATGARKRKLYSQTFNKLKKQWEEEITNIDSLSLKNKTLQKAKYKSYNFPFFLNDTVIVALKSDFLKIDRFVTITKSGIENVVCEPGFYFKDRVTYNNNTLCWTEIKPHYRWQLKSDTKFVTFNVLSNTKNEIITNGKYYSPIFSPTNSMIAAVQAMPDGLTSIAVLDVMGNLLKQHVLAPNYHATNPVWINDKTIAFVEVSDEGNAIKSLNINNNEIKLITPFTYSTITDLSYDNNSNSLVFIGSYSGKEDIYTLNLATNECKKIINSLYGAKEALVLNNKVLYCNYTSDGFKLKYDTINNAQTIDLKNINDCSWALADMLTKQELGSRPIDTIIQDSIYESSPYSSKENTINFHSRIPTILSFQNNIFLFNYSFFSQNTLGSSMLKADIGYVNIANALSIGLGVKHEKYFTTFDFGFYHRTFFEPRNKINDETRLYFYAGVPLLFLKDKYGIKVNFKIGFDSEVKYLLKSDKTNRNRVFIGDLNSLVYSNFQSGCFYNFDLTFSKAHKLAHRDFAPKLGYYFQIKGLLSNNNSYLYFITNNKFYLPGFDSNHSFLININTAFEAKAVKEKGMFYLSPSIRGVNANEFYNSLYKNNYSFLFNYCLPLFYPDFEIGGIYYSKRIRANFFYDFMNASNSISSNNNKIYQSLGVEVIFDGHFFGLEAPTSVSISPLYNFLNKKLLIAISFNLSVF